MHEWSVRQIRRAISLSHESQMEFRQAHERGMEQLSMGDIPGLIEAIDAELRAISKQQDALNLISPRRRSGPGW